MFITNVDPRRYDTSCEDPSLDIERDDRVHRTSPFIEDEQVDCSKCIDAVDGDRNDERKPKITVREKLEARSGTEIAQALKDVSRSSCDTIEPLTMKSHFCSGRISSTLTLPEQPIVKVLKSNEMALPSRCEHLARTGGRERSK